MIGDTRSQSGSQISVLRDGERSLLYCCHSLRVKDMAGNPHVLSVGIDLAPALSANGENAQQIIDAIADEALSRGGEASIPPQALGAIAKVANVLNIAWIRDALENSARIICPRSTRCPRAHRCAGAKGSASARARDVTDVRQEIMSVLNR